MIKLTDTLTSEVTEFRSLSKMCKHIGLNYNISIRDVPTQGVLFKERYLIDMTEYDHGSLYVFNYRNNSIRKHNGKVHVLAKEYKMSVKTIYKSIRQKCLVREVLAFSHNPKDFGSHSLKQTYKIKEKDDLSVNGKFIKPEPKRRVVRAGKLGVNGIRQRLGYAVR